VITEQEPPFIDSLVTMRKNGYRLDSAFYQAPIIHRTEMQNIWRRVGLFAGRSCEVPDPDDYFTFNIDQNSLIILRNDNHRIHAMPNYWNHSSCDPAVSTRLLPAGPGQKQIRVTWLVYNQTTEGVDDKREHLIPFWQKTPEQDWSICERVQQGVISSRFKPDPYSTYKEYNVEGLVRWYLKAPTATERSST